jgi:hypothetical protein
LVKFLGSQTAQTFGGLCDQAMTRLDLPRSDQVHADTTSLRLKRSVRGSRCRVTSAIPSVLTQEALAWTHSHPVWPTQPLPTVPITLIRPLRVLTDHALNTQEWHTTIRLGHHTLSATILLSTTMARPQGVLRQAQWTWIVTAPSQRVTGSHGGSYTLPSTTWTERGQITRQ